MIIPVPKTNIKSYEFFLLNDNPFQVLFDHSKCFEIECFTKHCMDILQSPEVLIVFGEGHARALKITAESRAEALSHVRACYQVAREAVKAEFPHFDIIMSFKVFQLGDGCPSSDEKHEPLQCLCQVWNTDFQNTLAEFQQVFRIAQSHKKSSWCSNREAWQWAMARAIKTKWPLQKLEPVSRF